MPSGRLEVVSDSVPPDPEHDAGWAIWNGVACCEGQPHQFGGCSFCVIGHQNNSELVLGLEIESRPTLGDRRRIVPSFQMAMTRWRGLLLSRLRPAQWALRVGIRLL